MSRTVRANRRTINASAGLIAAKATTPRQNQFELNLIF
jgi:hypothetical protein